MEKDGYDYGVQNEFNRTHGGRYVYAFTMIVSWLLIFNLLKIFEEFPSNWNTIISTLTTGILFLVVYSSLEQWIWKINLFFKISKHPNISGTWFCDGVSSFHEHDNVINKDIKWKATVIILQSWSNVKIRIETEHSVSNSISAAIVYDDIDECKLLYNYENRPKNLNHAGSFIHKGFGDLTISKDNESAIFKYYNVDGRETIATMSWKRLAGE